MRPDIRIRPPEVTRIPGDRNGIARARYGGNPAVGPADRPTCGVPLRCGLRMVPGSRAAEGRDAFGEAEAEPPGHGGRTAIGIRDGREPTIAGKAACPDGTGESRAFW